MVASKNSALSNYATNFVWQNQKPAVNFQFRRNAGCGDKGCIIFSVFGNNLYSPLIIACSWWMYGYDQGTKQYDTWEDLYDITKLAEPTNVGSNFGFIKMMVSSTDHNKINVVIRETPLHSSLYCVSTGGLVLENITETD